MKLSPRKQVKMQEFAHHTYRFDGFTLDITRGSLLHGPDEVKLRPKSFKALQYLVENSGRLVSKDELVEAVWGDTAVTDNSIVQCLKEVRIALGDRSQRYVRTVPKRGYIFEGYVTANRSVAVLPFVNESGNPDIEYLSDGMTDTLISSLSELPNIKVKARTSVFRYKGKEIDPKAIGRELGVEAIVNGRVAQRDGRTNVTLEVVDTETENIIFSTGYDRVQSQLVTLQSDIARDLSTKLKKKLSGTEEAKLTKTHTSDPEALQLYLKGQFYRHKGGRINVLNATNYFNKAIEKDPNYALAYASLALNYGPYSFYNIAPPSDYRPKAKVAAERAIELDDSLPAAHVALGGEREYRRAIELNPNYAEAHDALCIFLTFSKRFEEAITEGEKAQELDPLSAIITTHLATAYAFARRPDEAIELLNRAHELDPTLFLPLGYLGFAQTLKGQYAEAIASFRKAIEVSEGSPNPKGHLAYALARTGRRDEALKLVHELRHQAAQEYISSFHFAIPSIGLGNKDEAFFWLEKGVSEQSIGFAALDTHPWFDDLRSDPRFTALLNRTRLEKVFEPFLHSAN